MYVKKKSSGRFKVHVYVWSDSILIFLFIWFINVSSKSTPGCLASHFLQVSSSVVSKSLWPHGPKHARPPCPSPTPRACSNSCPSSRWCYPTISSSVVPFSSHLQSFPASGSFPMSQLFASGGPSIGVWASASVLPVNIQGWFPLRLTGWISFQSKGLSSIFFSTTVQNINSSALSFLSSPTLIPIRDYWKYHRFD